MPRKTKMNDLTSPELVAQINPDNLRLKKDFLDYLKSIQRSPGTINGYDNDLNIFFVYCLKNLGNKSFQRVSKRDIISFQNYLINENGNSPARVRRIKSSISSLSNFIEAILDDDPEFKDFRPIVRKIESPVNQPVREKTVLTDEQADRLLDYLVERGKYEQACCFALARYSGRRKSELVRFKVSYFDDSNIIYGTLYRTPEKIKTKGRGVNGKMLTCYVLSKPFKPYLDMWLSQRKELGIKSEWLFPDKDNPAEPLSVSVLNSWALSFSRILEIPVYWHSLRHFFTTNLVKSGIPDGVITDMIGWDSVDMCKVYTDVNIDDQLGMYFSNGEIVGQEKKELSDL